MQQMGEIILRKALLLFNEQGYMEVGMRQIARELDISPGNLTYHFKKKEEILKVLMGRFAGLNSRFYEEYFASPPSLERFMLLMKNIFESQYEFRGVYIGNYFVQSELQRGDRFDYRGVARKRRDTFKKIFAGLQAEGQINISGKDIEFLLSFITLFGRFWLSEATIFEKSPEREKTIAYYLSMLGRQMSFFFTEEGRESLSRSGING
jgi:AcrR family transcriptional regulator